MRTHVRFSTQCVYEGNCTPHKVNPGRIRLGNMSYKSSRSAIFFFLFPLPLFFFLHRVCPSVSLKPVGTTDSCHDKAMKKYLPEKLQPRGRYSSFCTELHGNSNLSARDWEGESATEVEREKAQRCCCAISFSPSLLFPAKRSREQQKINFANNQNILRGNKKGKKGRIPRTRFPCRRSGTKGADEENSSLLVARFLRRCLR